ncbi:MAG: hypothetical protein ACFFD4_21895 [Candidatus Odinarchaeota archaeon]
MIESESLPGFELLSVFLSASVIPLIKVRKNKLKKEQEALEQEKTED